MNSPTLSIITTSLNRKDLLIKTLDSVLEQDYPAIEQIVIDGGSQDGTPELLGSYESVFAAKGFFYQWLSEKDSGQASAMNKGLALATGTFITILNSDDYWIPGAIAKLMRVLIDGDYDIVFGRECFVDEVGIIKPSTYTYRSFTLLDMLMYGFQIPQSGCIFLRKILDATGGFDESLHYVAEHELFIRMVKEGARVYFLDEPIQIVLQHAGRKTNVNYGNTLEETRRVTFLHGGRKFSVFYLVYLKNKYFKNFFDQCKRRFPSALAYMKKYIFQANRISHRRGIRL